MIHANRAVRHGRTAPAHLFAGLDLRTTTFPFRSKRLSPPARGRVAAWVLAGLLAGANVLAAEGVKVDVEVEGLSGDLKRNAEASMMLASASAEGRLSEGEARRLVARAKGEVESSLQPYGYYRPAVDVQLDTERDPWKARFVVDRGPPLPISEVDVRVTGPGAEAPEFQRPLRAFPLRPGDRLEHAPYEALKVALGQAAAQNGYLDASFVTRRIAVDLEAYSARIEVHYETGQRYFFGPVRFHQDVLDSAFLQSFVGFKTGEPYNLDSLTAMQGALGASPYFSRVEVEPRRDETTDLMVPIDVRLERARPLRYTLGAGYGTDTGIMGQASLELRRLNRSGHRASIHALISELRITAGIQYQIPRFIGRKQLLTASAALIDEETDVQRTRGGALGLTLTRSRGLWHESFGAFFTRQEFTVGPDHGTPDLLYPEVSWKRVDGDDPIKPRVGTRFIVSARAGSEAVLSDVGFAQLNLEGKALLGLGRRDRVIARLEGGRTRTDDFHALPPGIRYFAGGAQSVRAYGYQDLGPRDDQGLATGGEALAFGSLEYEHLFFGDWGAATFYDIGNAFHDWGDPLADGAGAGIRWASPVGMVRLDFAWPIDDPANGMQFQFSIGPDL